MYIPRETPTVVTALSAAITPHPTSVPDDSKSATGLPANPAVHDGSAPFPFDGFGLLLPGPLVGESPIHPRDETPALPFPFSPDIEDQKFYRLGEDPLEGCIRDAIKEAGRERWYEITSNGGWTDFLVQSREHGLIGQDSNSDANEVNGLLDQVRTQAVADNPKLDRATNDTEKCASLVKQFTTEQLLDEIILSWAYDHGHIRDLSPTKPQLERRHVITDLILDNEAHTKMEVIDGVIGRIPKKPDDSDGNGRPMLIKVGDGAIGFIPKRSHVPANTTVPDNSTLLAKCKADVDELLDLADALIDWIRDLYFPGNSTVPENSTLLAKSTVPHNLTRLIDQLPPRNLAGPLNSIPTGNSARRINSTFLTNSTSHGSLLARRSFNAASLVDEISSEVDKDITEGIRVAGLADPDILDIFGQDGDRLKGFLDQPVVHDLMYATTKKHHKHGKHGQKKDSVWADPKFVSKFIKDSVEGVKNSAQILDGVVRAAEHKAQSKHKGHSES